jgi:hypothetical protein
MRVRKGSAPHPLHQGLDVTITATPFNLKRLSYLGSESAPARSRME